MHYGDFNVEPLGHTIDGGGFCSDMLTLLNDIDCSLSQFSFLVLGTVGFPNNATIHGWDWCNTGPLFILR